MHDKFPNRAEAGLLLADKLARHAGLSDVLVLALPRGGVPVGFAVADRLRAPLDVLVVRKLGVPGHGERALGALASGGLRLLNGGAGKPDDLSGRVINSIIVREQHDLERSERVFRLGHHAQPVRNRTVILVDDGIATGATMRVAITAVRGQHARKVIVAAPVAARTSYLELRGIADEVVALFMPKEVPAVGEFYVDYAATSDREVAALLTRARQNRWRGGEDAFQISDLKFQNAGSVVRI